MRGDGRDSLGEKAQFSRRLLGRRDVLVRLNLSELRRLPGEGGRTSRAKESTITPRDHETAGQRDRRLGMGVDLIRET